METQSSVYPLHEETSNEHSGGFGPSSLLATLAVTVIEYIDGGIKGCCGSRLERAIDHRGEIRSF